jgi:hypothetical protein
MRDSSGRDDNLLVVNTAWYMKYQKSSIKRTIEQVLLCG